MAIRELTGKQRAWLEAYISNGYNGTAAARSAGYNGDDRTLAVIAYDNIRNTNIKAELDKRFFELTMSANEVLSRLTAMARADVALFVDDDGEISVNSDTARQNTYLIKKLRTRKGTTKTGDKWTEKEIELHDPQAALVHIGRHLKLFTDRVESDANVHVDDWRAGKDADEIAAIEEAARIVNAKTRNTSDNID